MLPTELRLLGSFQISAGGAAVAELSSRMQMLLAYILLQPGRAASRQQIAFTLWPDSSDGQARTNLRRLLFLLRRELPEIDDLLELSSATLAWRPRAAVFVDLLAFEEGIGAGEAGGTARRAALAAAVDAYGGDLLPDCYEEWVLAERERLRNAYTLALVELTRLAARERDYPAAVDYARRLLRHDPFHEPAYRRLMRLLALTGDRAGSLQTYHTCATFLRRELGVEPGPETQQLYAQLLAQESATPPPVETGPVGTAGPMVGRTEPWRLLRKLWREESQAAPHWALISGEAGMGKSRLAEELMAWADRQAIPVAYARSYASTGRLSYGLWVDLLRSDDLRRGWEKLADHWLVELSRLLPELHNSRPDLPPPAPLAEAWQKRRLFEALVQALTGDGRPHLLVLDDVQWADPESLSFLVFLLRARPPARLLLVCTARSEEMVDNASLQAVVAEAEARGQLTHLPLAPLSVEETGQLAAQAGGAPLDEAALHALYADSGGNPLFVVEMARSRAWRATGQGEGSGQAVVAPLTDAQWSLPSLPPKVQAIIEARLARLSPGAREIAAQAAVLGRSFRYAVLAAATQLDELALVDGLDELWRRQVIREVGGDGYDFSHDRIRDVAYGLISQARRRLLHRRAGEALRQVHREALGPVHGQLGYHFASAGESPAAIDHYRQAAAVALERYAHAEAAGYLTAAITLAERLGDAAVYPLLAERERVHRTARQMDAGAADLALLTPLVARLDDGSPAAIRRTALVTLSRHYYASWARNGDLALRLAQETVELAQRCGDQAIETEAVLRYGQELFGQGRFDAAETVLAAGYELATAAGLPILAALSLERQASILITIGGSADRIEELLLESLRLYGGTGSESRISDILSKLGYALVVRGNGDYGEALAHLEQGLAIGQRAGNRAGEMKVLRGLVALHTCLGEYSRAEAYLNLMLDQVARPGEPNRAMYISWLGFWLLQQGRLSEASAAQASALALLEQQQQHIDIPRVATLGGWIAFYLGHWQQAEAYATRGVVLRPPFDGSRITAHALTCRGWARLYGGQAAQAVADFERSAEILQQLGMTNRAQEPLAGLAQAAARQGDLAAAQAQAVPIARHLLSHPLDRTVETFFAVQTCHTILAGAQDALADDLYALAHGHLQQRAAQIRPEHQDAFWSMRGYAAYRAAPRR